MNSSNSIVGRIGGVVFGLVFAGFGLLFIGVMAASFWSDSAKKDWPLVDCRIVSSSVVPSDGEGGGFNAVVRFKAGDSGPAVDGTYTAHKEQFTEAKSVADQFSAGSTVPGRRNPTNPSEVVLDSALKADSAKLLVLPFLLIPLIFVVIGFGIAWKSIRVAKAGSLRTASISGSVSGKAGNVLGSMVLLFMGTIFTLIGGGTTWVFTVGPAMKLVKSQSWVETRCTIELSRVVSSKGSKGGRTYRPEVLFRYDFDGKTYRSSQVSFMTVSSSGRDGKEEFVRNLPVGGSALCFVNPQNPAEALLDRSWSWGMLLGLLPMIFLLIGIALLVAGVRSRRKLKSPSSGIGSALRQEVGLVSKAEAGTRTLAPASSPMFKVFGTLLFCLFWNGITGIFVGIFVNGWMKGRPEWFLGIFMIPFVGVGLFLVGFFIRQLLALANPRPTLEITPGNPQIGGRFSVRWKFNGAVHRMSRVRVHLVGRESATYSRGTTTTTDKSVFLRLPIAEVTDHATMRDGSAEIVLPNDTAPSFEANHNKLEWLLVVEGEIPRWPDVDDEFPVTVVSPETSVGAIEPAPSGPELIEDSGFRLGVRGGRHAFLPGEVVEGVAAWSLAGAPKSADVRLFWFTEGKGTTDVSVVQTESFTAMQAQDARPFRFELPRGPVSVDGRLVSVKWAIELVARAQTDQVLRWDLVVSPSGRPVALPEAPADPKRTKSSIRFAGR